MDTQHTAMAHQRGPCLSRATDRRHDGRQYRDLVHASDIARANLLALESDRSAGEVFNADFRGGKTTDVLAG